MQINKFFSKKYLLYFGVIVVGGILIVILWSLMSFFRNDNSKISCDRGEDKACSKEGSIFFDAAASDQERLDDLLSRMTLNEKIAQMVLVEKNSISPADVRRYGIGAVLSGSGGKPKENTASGWRDMVNEFQAAATNSRLGIPILYGVDANHGHSNVPGATVFPHAIGLGAAGDPELARRVAQATAEEVLATSINWIYGPSLDAPQDNRWGRTYEAFGESASLVKTLGEAYVRGAQMMSPDTNRLGMLATAKHYLGVGGMRWGTSMNADFKIDQGQTPADERLLRQEYLPPFASAISAGVGSVMVGLNKWGDTYTTANHYLLTDVLKNELEFKGFVVSDWYGVYEMPGSKYQNSIAAINAGVDMVMLPFEYKQFIRDVSIAVERGEISRERIDDAARRILAVKYSLGLLDPRPTLPIESIGSNEHRELAREAVGRSLVLLKNNDVLPLNTSTKKIIVAGSAADNIGLQSGGWTVEWQGIDGNWLPGATSILQGIRENAPKGTLVAYGIKGEFEDAPQVDIGIAVVGEKPYAEGWGDNEAPSLSADDQAVITRLRSKSKKLIVIVVSGRPLLLGKAPSLSDALIAAWLPGSEGAGVADALFGKTAINGKLPVSWPPQVSDFSVGKTPLYPVGFGIKSRLDE
jgi:beta-glucosidase